MVFTGLSIIVVFILSLHADLASTAWRYIYSSNVIQGPCVYPDFDPASVVPTNGRKKREAIDDEAAFVKRVVNGRPADVTNWPWIVAILTPDGTIPSQGRTWGINCGGTLIHPEFVLTAAHCVISTENDTYYWRRNAQDLLARIGDNNLNSPDFPFIDIPIDQTYTHPLYNPLNVDTGNDIALLHLSKRLDRASYEPLRIACLPLPLQTVPAGSPCMVAGWGAVSTDGDTSPVALYTLLTMSTWAQCQQGYGFQTSASADGRMFCAGPPPGSGPTDTCTGDSGGGIFCRDPAGTGLNSLWQYMGLVSFGGTDCAPQDLTPGVYTNVAYYRQWVLDTITANSAVQPQLVTIGPPAPAGIPTMAPTVVPVNPPAQITKLPPFYYPPRPTLPVISYTDPNRGWLNWYYGQFPMGRR